MRSPFDGASRRPLRIAIGAVAAVDVAALAYALLDVRPSALSHPRAPGALLALGGHPLLIAPIAAAGIAGAFLFARKPARIAPGLVALATPAVLCESHGAILVGPMRVFFTSGAVLLGWIAGLAFARWMAGAAPADAASEGRAEALAEAGAVAALAATYVGAAASKLLASGLSWADANTLRAIVLLQRGLPGRSPFDFYAEAVLTYPAIAWTLSALTLVTQASAILYPWTPRLRAICGTLLLAFHLNVWLLTPIFFPQAMALLVVLSYPWPRIFARRRSPSPTPSPEPGPAARASLEAPPGAIRAAALRTGAVTLALIALAAMPFVRAYTHLHHRREPSAASEPNTKAGPDVRALLAGVTEGSDLAGFRVEAITGPSSGAILLKLSRGPASFTVALTKRGARAFEPPKKSARYDLFYDRVRPDTYKTAVPPPDIDRALSELASRLAETESAVPMPAGL